MGIRKLKPTTPGQRHKVIGAFDKITASTPEKSLVVGKKSTGGRNNTGKMTMRYIGGGHKQKYRIIDFKRNKDGIPATVKSIEYDPNRTSRIALLYYADGAKSYIIAPNGLEVGQTVVSGSEAFSTGKKTGRAATRTIASIGIERCGEEVRLTYTGDGFLYNMVRILTGTLLEVGLGERRPDDMEAILASHSRASAGFTAPAQGLFLWDVTY